MAEARLAVVETIARLAAEHKVDAVLVAGDVFDAQTIADHTIRKLFNLEKAVDPNQPIGKPAPAR